MGSPVWAHELSSSCMEGVESYQSSEKERLWFPFRNSLLVSLTKPSTDVCYFTSSQLAVGSFFWHTAELGKCTSPQVLWSTAVPRHSLEQLRTELRWLCWSKPGDHNKHHVDHVNVVERCFSHFSQFQVERVSGIKEKTVPTFQKLGRLHLMTQGSIFVLSGIGFCQALPGLKVPCFISIFLLAPQLESLDMWEKSMRRLCLNTTQL